MGAYTDYPKGLAIQPIKIERQRKRWFGLWGKFVTKKVWAYCLLEDLRWEVGFKGSGLWITVPKGFVTDLASIPRIGWSLFNGYAPETAKAAAVHDWLRPTSTDLIPQERSPWDVQVAAGEFFHCLKADEVPRWRRKVLYLIVVYFGTRKEEW